MRKKNLNNIWLAVVCMINKICAGENTSRDTSEELQEPMVRKSKNPWVLILFYTPLE